MLRKIGGGVITGLTCNTTYHFRALALNTGGTSIGADATFITSSDAGCAFTDDPLSPTVAVIKAVHIAELRVRIDALRARYISAGSVGRIRH